MRKIRFSFRFDDPSPTSDRAVEQSIVEILVRHGACATLAVIPFADTKLGERGLVPGDVSHLRPAIEKGIIEIALHGCFHRDNARQARRPSEFRGMPETEQRSMLRRGLDRLLSVLPGPIAGFVPPWNSYDVVTARAAHALGFRYISAGWEMPEHHCGTPLPIPRTCSVLNVRAALGRARIYSNAFPVVVSVLHPYDFHETGDAEACIDMSGFERLVNWVRHQADVEIVTLRHLAEKLDSARLRTNIGDTLRAKRLHWQVARRWPSEFFPTGSRLDLALAVASGGVRVLSGRAY